MLRALIFDCDGVLVDTERDGHRVGFNRAFEQMGIDASWSVELYGKLLLIAGGKERMRAYFDEYGWPERADTDAAKEELILKLHKLKTEITSGLIAEGSMPLRPGISRIVDEAIAAGTKLGVCTTSNPKFIDAVLDLFGPERKAKFDFVHAGDVVAKKKPAPDIYELAKQSLGLPAHQCMVIEDSRNGLLAARGAGLPTLITTSTYTVYEDFSGAAKVVPELGNTPGVTLAELSELAAASQGRPREGSMTDISQAQIERAIQTTAATVLKNEHYFSDLDGLAGDGDFGTSLATGFRVIQNDWETIDKADIGTMLLKLSMLVSKHVGGSSGPIWGTGFMKAALLSKGKSSVTLEELSAMVNNAIEGIMARGGAKLGDKTLLDALIPVNEVLKSHAGSNTDLGTTLKDAADAADTAIDETRHLEARRGRASQVGERSGNTPDPGIVAIAKILQDWCTEYGVARTPKAPELSRETV